MPFNTINSIHFPEFRAQNEIEYENEAEYDKMLTKISRALVLSEDTSALSLYNTKNVLYCGNLKRFIIYN